MELYLGRFHPPLMDEDPAAAAAAGGGGGAAAGVCVEIRLDSFLELAGVNFGNWICRFSNWSWHPGRP